MGTVSFYFDFISPYAYLGWNRLGAIRARPGVALEPIPVLFAGLLNAYGHKGPAEIPPKRLYMWKHVVRLAAEQTVPIAPPPAHPFNPLLALRVAALPFEPATRDRVIDALFRAVWAGGGGVTDPDHVARLLEGLGLEGAALVEAARAPEAKARIRTLTDDAIATGVFGVPCFEVDGELFWGQDSLPHVEAHLEGRDPAGPETIARWRDIPVGAVRTPR